MEKRTDSEIKEMELWAKKVRKNGFTSADEKYIVERIEAYQAADWKGIRIKDSDKVTNIEEAKAKFERLKRDVN